MAHNDFNIQVYLISGAYQQTEIYKTKRSFTSFSQTPKTVLQHKIKEVWLISEKPDSTSVEPSLFRQ